MLSKQEEFRLHASELRLKIEHEEHFAKALEVAGEDPRLIAGHRSNIRTNRYLAWWFDTEADALELKEQAA